MADVNQSGDQNLPPPALEDMQHWTWVMGRMQQMTMEHSSAMGEKLAPSLANWADPAHWQAQMASFMGKMPTFNPDAQAAFWSDAMTLWQGFIDQSMKMVQGESTDTAALLIRSDRRFNDAKWRDNPVYALIHQSYLMLSEHMLAASQKVDGLDPRKAEQIRFATQNIVDALSPSNFALTNPLVMEKTLESKGDNLLKGLDHMLADIRKGQLTHTDAGAFELGKNIATTPGKVIYETPLLQLIQYTPTTEMVYATPLVIFPPWINRFYILDLKPEKSFVKWAVDQGLSVFMVSWKSADASMADMVWDDYINAQIDVIEQVNALLGTPSVHAIGYCVAGTTLATTLAHMAKRGDADKVKSATYFTAQVDFEKAGDLQLLVDDDLIQLIESVTKDGYLDGRYLAMTFNMLRGRDLIWNYVTSNYLMGDDYPPFDLLHWNGDTTNLPAKWHGSYLRDLYRDNKLVVPGALSVNGVPVDLRDNVTPSYIQAGREDHIAPVESVWRLTQHLSGPLKFVLAGSGHIAGVVNPPSAQKYQYWTNTTPADTLADFVAGATETKGSWWPDWIIWLDILAPERVKANKARVPGKGRLKAIEDAPGRYVVTR